MMRRFVPCTVLSAFFSLLISSPTWGQTPAGTVDSIRAAIKELEKKLHDLEQPPAAQSNRITRIGESKGPDQSEEKERILVQLYDLGDLFAVTPVYAAMLQSDLSANTRSLFPIVESTSDGQNGTPLGGGLGGGGGFGGGGGGGGGFFAVPAGVEVRADQNTLFQFGGGAVATPPPTPATAGNLAGSRVSLDGLMDAIKTTIEPDSWDDAGGPGSMARIGNSILISTTADTHRQIGELLQLFRKRWGTLRTVSVRGYWLWLTERQLDGLLVHPQGEPKESINTAPFGLVIDEVWKELLNTPKLAKGESHPSNYFATLTGYNGQTVHTLAGSQRNVVTGLIPVLGGGTDPKVGYSPTTSVVQEGAALQVTPLTSTNAKYVVLDIHSRVSRLIGSDARHPEATAKKETPKVAGDDVVAALDQPILAVHRLSTTLRVPTGQVLLVGGLSSEFGVPTDGLQLYLFVQAFVQELRDDPLDK